MRANIFKSLGQAATVSMIRLFGLDQTMASNSGKSGSPDEINNLINQALGGVSSNPAYASIYTSYVRSEMERRKQYKEYDTMEDESEVISTALDIYAEDATDMDSFVGRRVWVTSDNDAVQKEANEAIQKLGLEKNSPRIIRNLAKYGDFFLGLHYNKQDKEKARKEGVTRIDTSYYPRDVMPIVKDYKLLGYWVLDAEKVTTIQDDCLKAPWEFVHFAVPGDANFITYDTPLEYEMKRSDMVEYGQSLLKASRKPYKRSKLMHDILAIARITRSPLKRVFKFQTETNNPLAQIQSLAMFKKTMEKIGGVDKLNDSMQYDELMNIMTQDIYLPIGKDQKGNYNFETIGGQVDVSHVADVDMWDNRLFMSLRIPKEFLNFDAATGDKSTLLIKDVRYAKRIKKLQQAYRTGIKEFLFIHFALKGTVLTDDQLEVHMASTSISDDLQRLDYYNSAVSTADTLVRMLDTFMVKVEVDAEGNPIENRKYDREYLAYYILKYVVKLPNFNSGAFNAHIESYEAAEKKEGKGNAATQAKSFVESNKALCESIFKKVVGEDLREAAEELNLNIEKSYRTAGVPENFDWGHDSLRTLCENIVKAKQNNGGGEVLA